jgi:hypothetical protein
MRTSKMIGRVFLFGFVMLSLYACTTGHRMQGHAGDDAGGRGVEAESVYQRHFGPPGRRLYRQSFELDLNDDGHPERIVLLRRPEDVADTDRIEAGLRQTVYVEGFEVYSGTDPDILLFYAYRDDRFTLRFDTVDGRELLVSDGGRDHGQYVWGWWEWHSDWRVDGWEARCRVWTPDMDGYGAWRAMRYIWVSYGK